MKTVVYCNGKIPYCKKTFCGLLYEDGGCFHTANKRYAKYENWREHLVRVTDDYMCEKRQGEKV